MADDVSDKLVCFLQNLWHLCVNQDKSLLWGEDDTCRGVDNVLQRWDDLPKDTVICRHWNENKLLFLFHEVEQLRVLDGKMTSFVLSRMRWHDRIERYLIWIDLNFVSEVFKFKAHFDVCNRFCFAHFYVQILLKGWIVVVILYSWCKFLDFVDDAIEERSLRDVTSELFVRRLRR